MTQILWDTQILCWMLLTQNGQNRQQEKLTLCLKSLRQSLESRLGTSLCLKHLTKAIPYKLAILSNLLNSTGKKLERQEAVYGYLSWWLKISLWQHCRTQIASDWVRGGDSKTRQRLEQCKEVFQSFVVSSGVAFSGNNDL